jgi:hypothetical protein
MEEEVASLLRVSPGTLERLRRKKLSAKFGLGNTVPWEMAEGLLERCKERVQRFGTNEEWFEDATEGVEEVTVVG